MRRPLKILTIAALVVGGLYWLVLKPAVRSTVVELGDTGYAVKYRMAWGWGMEERIDVFRPDSWLAGQSGDWMGILGEPYYSGMTLYRSEDGDTYFFGMKPGVYRFHVSTGQMDYHCVTEDIVSHTALARQGSSLSNSDRPSAFERYIYIEPSQLQTIPADPPVSQYYKDLRFLGIIGLTPGGRGNYRGGPPIFISSTDTVEPIGGLEGSWKLSSVVRDRNDC